MVSVMKSPNIMSTIGRMPVMAAPTADAGVAGLGDRRVDHALGAELLHQPEQDLEGGAGLGDVLADDEQTRVAAHLLGDRFADRLRAK